MTGSTPFSIETSDNFKRLRLMYLVNAGSISFLQKGCFFTVLSPLACYIQRAETALYTAKQRCTR